MRRSEYIERETGELMGPISESCESCLLLQASKTIPSCQECTPLEFRQRLDRWTAFIHTNMHSEKMNMRKGHFLSVYA